MTQLRSNRHQIVVQENDIMAVSPFDAQRFSHKNGVSSLAYGNTKFLHPLAKLQNTLQFCFLGLQKLPQTYIF